MGLFQFSCVEWLGLCLCFLCFFKINFCYGMVNCAHDLVKADLHVKNLKYKHESRIRNVDGNTNVDLIVDIGWTFSQSEDRPIDGFLFHLQSLESSPSSDFLPINACVPPRNQWWTNSSNTTSCLEKPSCTRPTSSSCVCEKNCFKTRNNCTHEIFAITDDLGGRTVHSDIRSLKFHLKYFRKYIFLIVPYDKFGVGDLSNRDSTLMISPISDCETLLETTGDSSESVSDTCCQNKADNLHYRARSVEVTQSRLDLTTGQYSMTVTWLPPIVDVTDRYYDVIIERVDGSQEGMEQVEDWNEIKSNRNATDAVLQCDSSDTMFTGKILYLLPGTEYYIDVYTVYEDEGVCEPYEECTASAYFTTSVIPSDPCAEYACVENATCTVRNSRPIAVCRCDQGFFGDGKNQTTWGHGSGCSFINSNFTDTGYEIRPGAPIFHVQPTPTSKVAGSTSEVWPGSGEEAKDEENVKIRKNGGTTFVELEANKQNHITPQLSPSASASGCASHIDCVISEHKYVILAVGGVLVVGLAVLLAVICWKCKTAGERLKSNESKVPSSASSGRDDFEIVDMRQVRHVT